MNEDYLWNKTGNDAEIENLESLLSQFRYQETSAPNILPEKVSEIEQSPKRPFFSLSFAFSFASSVAFIMILLGVWFQFSIKSPEKIGDLSKSITPEIKIVLPVEQEKEVLPEDFSRNSEKIEKPTFIKAKSSEPKNAAQKTFFIKKKGEKPKAETLELTEEEKFAYDQLMLALSITSSKLKMVKDKIALDETPEIIVRKEINKGRN